MKRNAFMGACLVVLACTVGGHRADASWPVDPGANVALCVSSGQQTQTVSASDGAGGAIIAWVDTRGGGADLYSQHVSADGSIAPGWPAQGLALCLASGTQRNARIVTDGFGGAILVWEDLRAGDPALYAQRVGGDGTLAPGWPADGLEVCATAGGQSSPSICADAAGGALVAWQDGRPGTVHDIYAQHLLAAGSLDPAWPTTGLPICTAVADQVFPSITRTDAGSAIVAWQDARSGNTDIYGQRVTFPGVAMWTANGAVIAVAAGTQEKPAAVSDGAGGAYVCWTDYRSGVSTDVYAQRVTAGGSIPQGWGPSGNAIATGSARQSFPSLIADAAGGIMLVWVDSRAGEEDIYMQRMNSLGSIAPGWVPNGVGICRAHGSQVDPVIVPDGGTGAIVAWRDDRNDASYDIYGCRVTAGGAPASGWPADGVPVGSAPGAQTDLTLATAGAGGAIGAWADFRSLSTWDVYSQKIGPAVVLAAPHSIAASPSLGPMTPNPSHGRTSISFTLPDATRARVAIHDLAGRRVIELENGTFPPGRRTVEWDGRDASGREVPAGIYLVRLTSGGRSITSRIATIR